jgi:hypothetical protein
MLSAWWSFFPFYVVVDVFSMVVYPFNVVVHAFIVVETAFYTVVCLVALLPTDTSRIPSCRLHNRRNSRCQASDREMCLRRGCILARHSCGRCKWLRGRYCGLQCVNQSGSCETVAYPHNLVRLVPKDSRFATLHHFRGGTQLSFSHDRVGMHMSTFDLTPDLAASYLPPTTPPATCHV